MDRNRYNVCLHGICSPIWEETLHICCFHLHNNRFEIAKSHGSLSCIYVYIYLSSLTYTFSVEHYHFCLGPIWLNITRNHIWMSISPFQNNLIKTKGTQTSLRAVSLISVIVKGNIPTLCCNYCKAIGF